MKTFRKHAFRKKHTRKHRKIQHGNGATLSRDMNNLSQPQFTPPQFTPEQQQIIQRARQLYGPPIEELTANTLTCKPPICFNLENKGITELWSLYFTRPNLRLGWNTVYGIYEMPNSCKYFNCSYNRITSLPRFSTNLIELNCSHNQLTGVIDLRNTRIQVFNCSNNKITDIIYPETIRSVNISNNPLALNSNALTIPFTALHPSEMEEHLYSVTVSFDQAPFIKHDSTASNPVRHFISTDMVLNLSRLNRLTIVDSTENLTDKQYMEYNNVWKLILRRIYKNNIFIGSNMIKGQITKMLKKKIKFNTPIAKNRVKMISTKRIFDKVTKNPIHITPMPEQPKNLPDVTLTNIGSYLGDNTIV